MFGQKEPHFDARESDRRKNSGHQNDGDEARENQEKEVVSGVQGGERDEDDSSEIDPAFARDAVLHLVTDPAERGALRKNGNESHSHPAGDDEGRERRRAGKTELAEFRSRAGIQRQEQRGGERRDREEEGAHGGGVGRYAQFREGGMQAYSGT